MIIIRTLKKITLYGYSIVVAGLTFFSCAPALQRNLKENFIRTESQFQDHTGFALYDLAKDKMVFDYQADKYFTPASNTKILTLYTCLTILGDSLPALRYVEKEDSLILWGTGDPTFLNRNVFNTNKVYAFLSAVNKPLYFSTANFFTDRYGEGWGWDDYNGSYQAERSTLTIYGNLMTATLDSSELFIQPTRFAPFVSIKETKKEATVIRTEFYNRFSFYPSYATKYKEFETPFITGDSLFAILLEDTLHREVTHTTIPLRKNAHTLYSIKVDSAYKTMMQESDNFLAEQLLLMCSGVISDSLKPEAAIRFMHNNHLAGLPDKLIWVDGSGLSRYNLFTPRSIVAVWKKIYEKMPTQKLLPLLATGGVNGTIKNWYKAETPYIFGKTGTLANNHCLSGYLITKSGNTLVFSFMNSNYLATNSDIRSNMQHILEYIRDNYR